jgi:hypothetical protein
MRILFPEAETPKDGSIPGFIGLLQIADMLLPLGDKLQKAPPRMMVLGMGFEVLGKIIDPFAEKGYLYLSGTCIRVMDLVRFNDLFLLLDIKHALTTFLYYSLIYIGV